MEHNDIMLAWNDSDPARHGKRWVDLSRDEQLRIQDFAGVLVEYSSSEALDIAESRAEDLEDHLAASENQIDDLEEQLEQLKEQISELTNDPKTAE